MSIEAMAWAIKQQITRDAPARHVLLCLASYADKLGKTAYPSASKLSADTGLSERTVRTKLDVLEQVGLITRGNQRIVADRIDRADRRPICFDLCISRPAGDAPRYMERGARDDTTGCSSRRNGVQHTPERGATAAANTSYKPSMNHSYAPPTAKRGPACASRLSEDWTLPDEWRLWALEDTDVNRAAKWSDDHVRAVAQRFRDYWIAQPDSRGLRLDWFATWRNWCRDSKAAMPVARKGSGGGWWLSPESRKAKAHEVGVGEPNAGESDASYQSRIQAAIDNGGKPPAPRQMPVTPLDPLPAGGDAAERGSELSRATTSAAKALLRQRSAGGRIAA
ncbi:helix-turn-helix domain-containing protein [Paraburkholderia sp. BL17N1]|uniref:helix-turn-helix domain-containing protein n=1 Tax=Paraburkholderia sp. BL17N1 TaxID=1938798 RepID=UPI000F0D42B2|nr:helix-turn-helix domain-containing protein [Paraburkholderia sp. BL17N1]RKR44565.1 helix-turn-helix protein [Paraburkholderia sp. BL17N1]